MEDALKWDGRDVRHMVGIARAASKTLSLRQPARYRLIPVLVTSDLVACDFLIYEELFLGGRK